MPPPGDRGVPIIEHNGPAYDGVLRKIAGYCPACGTRSLFVGSGGYVTCGLLGCPNPTLVADLLGDPEIEHVIEFREDGWTIKHPLRCRRDLFECAATKHAERLDGPPVQLGRYRMYLLDEEQRVQWERV